MISQVLILTGASRGIGRAIAEQFLSGQNGLLVTVSREPDDGLGRYVREGISDLKQVSLDLTDPVNTERTLEPIFTDLALQKFDAYFLVNNAGRLDPVAPLGRGGAEALAANMMINAVAPLILMDLFVRQFGEFVAEKRIINVSSGAGRNAYPGWAAYCSSKAALDMASACLKMEQEGQTRPVKIASFAPGVVDTGMQDQIRRTSPQDFPPVERFHALKKEGQLLASKVPAARILELLVAPVFPDEVILDIRDMG